MKNYKMTIQYDGTRYQGWQRLKDTDRSIQGKIEDVLSKMVCHKVEIHGSGRTDAGVHAKGQVASFKIECDMTDSEIRDYLNCYLPEDIAVTDICRVDDRFHARLTECRKTYLYRINNSNISDVFERKYVYQIEEKLDIEAMRKASEYLIGEHDFSGFSSLKKVKKSTVRTVYECRAEKKDNEIDIYITGDGFLYNMVRIIVGTLIEVGKGERCPEDILKVLESKNREDAGFTAPAQGLILYEVKYQ
ncbi:MAG: tRNA pseudouridine(38-40) synthase TruA [Clostridia bacterium]|nr:tRNA pseudouridine(38-40) synthase TruA [Clostridia bacterium]